MIDLFELNNKLYPVRLNQKGYSCISVQDHGTERAYLPHRVVYEATHGPVPEGHDIHHIDSDKSNWTLTNLTAMTRKYHLDLHRRARSTEEDNKAGMEQVKNPTHNQPENKP